MARAPQDRGEVAFVFIAGLPASKACPFFKEHDARASGPAEALTSVEAGCQVIFRIGTAGPILSCAREPDAASGLAGEEDPAAQETAMDGAEARPHSCHPPLTVSLRLRRPEWVGWAARSRSEG